MISFDELLQEAGGFFQYKAVVLFRYNTQDGTLGSEKVAELVRAIPGATRVSTASLDKDKGIVILNVKLISQKSAKTAFSSFKKNALNRFRGIITDVKIGAGTIETKNYIK